ncbi:hypothetical protein ColLi_13383 [Colletotrichum liriopes]|uniref:Uncharacterized protein n=1 Tax=Colletotrichum liriopes TaxID=708192 RepID=A0AA37H045_9PEZI|nr:hypothetical protein ColLi_13383 [Colletotrichum liriopes]
MAGYAPPKDKTKIYIQAQDVASHRTVSEERPSIRSICGRGAMEIDIISVDHGRPAGVST